MNDRIEADVDALRAAAGKTAEVHSQVDDILNGLKSSLEALGSAWGNDHYGAQFANGDGGHVTQVANQLEGLQIHAANFADFCDGQNKAVEILSGTEDATVERFNKLT